MRHRRRNDSPYAFGANFADCERRVDPEIGNKADTAQAPTRAASIGSGHHPTNVRSNRPADLRERPAEDARRTRHLGINLQAQMASGALAPSDQRHC